MITDWWRFTAERFPLQATLPLSLVLAAGALATKVWQPALALQACATVFLVLLGARIADDLADSDRDRLRHPERGLCCGRISPRSMKGALGVCCALALGLNPTLPALAVLAALIAVSALFHLFRRRVPLLLQTAFVNLPLLAIPLYGEALAVGAVSQRSLWAGLFLWLSALGHELGHSLGDEDSSDDGAARYTDTMSRAAVARLGAALYAAAGLAGMLFAARLGPGPVPALLAGWALLVGALLLRLVRDPRPAHARALYVPGFLFVLVPAGAAFAW